MKKQSNVDPLLPQVGWLESALVNRAESLVTKSLDSKPEWLCVTADENIVRVRTPSGEAFDFTLAELLHSMVSDKVES